MGKAHPGWERGVDPVFQPVHVCFHGIHKERFRIVSSHRIPKFEIRIFMIALFIGV